MKKIGIVLNQFPVHSEPFIGFFLKHLTEYEVYIFANISSNIEYESNWVYRPYFNKYLKTNNYFLAVRILFNGIFYFKRAFKLKRYGLKWKQIFVDTPLWSTKELDILHFPFASNIINREYYGGLLGAKLTISFRGSDLNVFPIYHNISYEHLWPFIHKIHCNSFDLALKLNEYNVPSKMNIELIFPALRSDLVNIEPVQINKIHIGTKENPLVIITLGRLHWVKDYPLALRIMGDLKKNGTIFKYHILGEGVEREQLMFLIKELGLEQNVHLHGIVGNLEIKQLFPTGHIYLQTSYAEGFSNACLEAQAYGLPCVVPSISGMNECIEDGKTGIIVKERKEKAFVSGIMKVLNNTDHFNSDYISNRIKEQFSLDKQRQKWLKFFEEIV